MLATLSIVLLLVPAPQDRGDPIVARFVLPDGSNGAVTRSELAREAAQRHRRSESGQDALKLVVDRWLVSSEAEAQGLVPTAEVVEQRIGEIRAALVERGTTLEVFLEAKRMSWDRFEEDFVRLSIAHERLLLKSLETDDRSEATPAMLELWLREARARHRVVLDEAELPGGIVAMVDEHRFDLGDLGRVLLPNVSDEERAKFVRRIVLRDLLRWRAGREGITVSEEETRAEIDARREQVERDPRFRGVSYEGWLKATQGMTVDDLARSAHMVATVQQQKLVDRLYPREELDRRLREDPAAVLRRHGEKRRLAIVLLRALKRPNPIVDRSFEEAREELAALRQEIETGEKSFRRVAQIHSEDPYSKVRGGDVGEFARESDDLPDEVLEVAFGLALLTMSPPIRVPQGYLLVKVTRIVPAPDHDIILDRLREELAQEFLAELLEAAEIEIVE